jgi:hypothetical protein
MRVGRGTDRRSSVRLPGGQHLVKEPTEQEGARRNSCDAGNMPRPGAVLVTALHPPS